MFDQIEHPLVRPVDVLPHEHQRPITRQALHARAHGREEDFARLLGILRLGGDGFIRSLDPEQTTDHGRL